MRAIYWLIIRKRWYVFIGLCLTSFLMNFFLWNEASQFIRQLPVLHVLRMDSSKDKAEFVYTPSPTTNSLSVAQEEALKDEFNRLSESNKIFSNKTAHLHGEELLPLTDDFLEQLFLGEGINVNLLHDLVLTTDSSSEKLLVLLRDTGAEVEILSWHERYLLEVSYYKNNLWFGLIVSLLFFCFTLALLKWLVKSVWTICQEEIKVLRLLGLSKRGLFKAFSVLLCSPILSIFLLFFLLIPLFLPVRMIIWDYVYLGGIAVVQMLLVQWMLLKQLKGDVV